MEESESPRWVGLTLSSKLVPRLGPERTGGSPCGDPGPNLRSFGGVAPGKEPEVTPGAQGLRRRQGDSRSSLQGHDRGANKGRRIKKWSLLKVPCSRRGRRHSPGQAAGPMRRAGAELRQTRRTSKPRAVNPQHRAPAASGARFDPATSQSRPQLLFARVASGAAANTVPPGSRGGRPSSPRRAAPSLSVSSPPARGLASSSVKPGIAGELLKLGGCSRHTAPNPGRPSPPPRGHPGWRRPSHLRGDNQRSGPPARRPTPPYQSLVQISLLGPTTRRETQRSGAEQRAAPPAGARRGAATSRSRSAPAHAPPPQHFRFQTCWSFKVISVRPAGRRPPARPLSSRRHSDESQTSFESRGAASPRASQPARQPLRVPEGPRPTPRRALRLPTVLPAPSPASTKSGLPGGLGWGRTGSQQKGATAGSGYPGAARQTPLRWWRRANPKGAGGV